MTGVRTTRSRRVRVGSRGPQKDKNFIALTEKIFAVLENFNENPRDSLSLDQITTSVALAKTTVHRLLYSMRRLGYIDQDAQGNYSLAPKFYELTGNALPFQHLTSIAGPVLNQLVTRYGESVHIGTLENGVVLFIAVAPSRHAYRCAAEIGECHYAHSTALGKCILANLSLEEREAVFAARGLPKMTQHSITDRSQLQLELERVRKQGWAVNEGENIEGVICVAAPIFGRGDRVLAALSISGPSSRMVPVLEELKRAVKQSSARLSILLGSRANVSVELVSAG